MDIVVNLLKIHFMLKVRQVFKSMNALIIGKEAEFQFATEGGSWYLNIKVRLVLPWHKQLCLTAVFSVFFGFLPVMSCLSLVIQAISATPAKVNQDFKAELRPL